MIRMGMFFILLIGLALIVGIAISVVTRALFPTQTNRKQAKEPDYTPIDPYSQSTTIEVVQDTLSAITCTSQTQNRLDNAIRQADAVARKSEYAEKAVSQRFLNGTFTYAEHMSSVRTVERRLIANLAILANKLGLFDVEKYETMRQASGMAEEMPLPSLIDYLMGRAKKSAEQLTQSKKTREQLVALAEKLGEYGIDTNQLVMQLAADSSIIVQLIRSFISGLSGNSTTKQVNQASQEAKAILDDMERDLTDMDFVISENEKMLIELDRLVHELGRIDVEDVRRGSKEALDDINETIGNIPRYTK